jgi:hypothetical protein
MTYKSTFIPFGVRRLVAALRNDLARAVMPSVHGTPLPSATKAPASPHSKFWQKYFCYQTRRRRNAI